MHVQSCCFPYKAIAFLPFSLPSTSSLLKLPNMVMVISQISPRIQPSVHAPSREVPRGGERGETRAVFTGYNKG